MKMNKIKSYLYRGYDPHKRTDMYLKWYKDKREYSDIPRKSNYFHDGEFQKVEKYYPKPDGWKIWKEENLAHFQDVLIHRYVKEGFYMIALGINTKNPLDDWTDPKYRLDEASARRHMLLGGNIGVVCSYSRLFGIDIDRKSVPEPFVQFMSRTLVSSSPRGYHMYFKNPKNIQVPKKIVHKIGIKYCVDKRDTIQYFVLPLSMLKRSPPRMSKKMKSDLQYREILYEFTNWKVPILDIEELLEVM
jgi:hypothetical protein